MFMFTSNNINNNDDDDDDDDDIILFVMERTYMKPDWILVPELSGFKPGCSYKQAVRSTAVIWLLMDHYCAWWCQAASPREWTLASASNPLMAWIWNQLISHWIWCGAHEASCDMICNAITLVWLNQEMISGTVLNTQCLRNILTEVCAVFTSTKEPFSTIACHLHKQQVKQWSEVCMWGDKSNWSCSAFLSRRCCCLCFTPKWSKVIHMLAFSEPGRCFIRLCHEELLMWKLFFSFSFLFSLSLFAVLGLWTGTIQIQSDLSCSANTTYFLKCSKHNPGALFQSINTEFVWKNSLVVIQQVCKHIPGREEETVDYLQPFYRICY